MKVVPADPPQADWVIGVWSLSHCFDKGSRMDYNRHEAATPFVAARV